MKGKKHSKRDEAAFSALGSGGAEGEEAEIEIDWRPGEDFPTAENYRLVTDAPLRPGSKAARAAAAQGSAKGKLTVLYETTDLVAVEKPAGLAVIPGRGETTSVLEELAEQLGLPSSGSEDPRLRVVHRLDKETSGVLLFAKHIEAQRQLSHQFQNNSIEKEYVALVKGRPVGESGGDSGTIDGPIAPHPANKLRMCVTKHGRPARTDWKVEQAFRFCSLVRCFPKTGKTHQIRVHLLSIGAPLLIDELYNPTSGPVLLSQLKRNYHAGKGGERPLMDRLTLHAERLRFVTPGETEMREVAAPLPKDFRSLLSQLGKLR